MCKNSSRLKQKEKRRGEMKKQLLFILFFSVLMPLVSWSGPLFQCVDRDGKVSLTDRWEKDYVKCVPLDYYGETPGEKSTARPEAAPVLEGSAAAGTEKSAAATQSGGAVQEGKTEGAGKKVEEGAEATGAPQAEEEPPPRKKPAYWPPRK
jgi:hypothetical protein